MTTTTEIAPDIFRISTYVAGANLQFNQFLIRDAEPLLYHTGQTALFAAVRAAVGSLIDVAKLRWIGFSHYEADECGSLNRWLALARRRCAGSARRCGASSVRRRLRPVEPRW